MNTLDGTFNKTGGHAHPDTGKRRMLVGMVGGLSMNQEMMANGDHYISCPEKAEQGKSEGSVPYEGS